MLVHAAAAVAPLVRRVQQRDELARPRRDRIECVDTKASGQQVVVRRAARPRAAAWCWRHGRGRGSRRRPSAFGRQLRVPGEAVECETAVCGVRASRGHDPPTPNARQRAPTRSVASSHGSAASLVAGPPAGCGVSCRKRTVTISVVAASPSHQALGCVCQAVALIGAFHDALLRRRHAEVEAVPVLHRAGAIGIEHVALVEHGVGDRPRPRSTLIAAPSCVGLEQRCSSACVPGRRARAGACSPASFSKTSRRRRSHALFG